MDYNTNRDFTQRDMSFQTWNLHTRRLSLLSNTIKDYQDNMRNVIRILGREVGNSSTVDRTYPLPRTPRNRQNVSFNAWLGQNEPPYSFTRYPPRHNQTTGTIPTNESRVNGLTTEQIANVTELIQYDASMNETVCPITWDPFEPGQEVLRINNCGHIFGQPALAEWFQSRTVCPVCRSSVRGDEDANSGNLSDSSSSSNQTINQLITGIINSLSGALNDEIGFYENEFTFNLSDLMEVYNPSLRQPTNTTRSEPSPSSNSDTPPN